MYINVLNLIFVDVLSYFSAERGEGLGELANRLRLFVEDVTKKTVGVDERLANSLDHRRPSGTSEREQQESRAKNTIERDEYSEDPSSPNTEAGSAVSFGVVNGDSAITMGSQGQSLKGRRTASLTRRRRRQEL